MTVVNPKSISGINSITMASGSDNLLTIHTNDTSEKVRVNSSGDVIVGSGVTLSPDGNIFATGVCTATSFVGSGANLTGVASTENIRTNTNATFLQNINVSGTSTVAGTSTANLFSGSGASLTSIPAANIVGVATAGFERTGGFSDYVKIATATWTSDVASVAIDNLDTTTYKYFVMLWNHVPEVDNSDLRFRWRLDGTDATASSYDWAAGSTYGYSTTNLADNADYAKVCFATGNTAWEGCQLEFVIYPKSSAEAGYQGNSVFVNGISLTNATSPRCIQAASFYDGGTTYYPNGFKLYQSAGNLSTGDYALYGVKR